MSYKRSRSTFEADLHAPYVVFGTPLPHEADRDEGSYLPLWKQDVRDEKGRRRLHGAFTGGWSAGYFNTVGSKEGWTPSTFVSSRSNRRKDEPGNVSHRAEDYMDEEDLADAAEAQQLKTSQAFAGLGSSTQDELKIGGIEVGLLRSDGDTMGFKLLQRMGWKHGQGIGSKVRRAARLDLGSMSGGGTHFFAPENTKMIQFTRKIDRKGIGHQGETKLALLSRHDDREDGDYQVLRNEDKTFALLGEGQKKKKNGGGSMGVGILNDTGSDEEDPYEIGPRIKYNRVIGGEKKKKKNPKLLTAVNPTLQNAPVFKLKTSRIENSLRRCHDGRFPLDGFHLSQSTEDTNAILLQFPPLEVPKGWKSSKGVLDRGITQPSVSSADAAKASTLDARSRAIILGEAALPGKSVFDFLSASARDKLASASGKANLPPGRGEIPAEFARSEEEQQQLLWDQVPRLDKENALVALTRSAKGPYADDEAKRLRYRQYLEHFANSAISLPAKVKSISRDDYLREMNEFYNCARIFKPMTGFMASRFTTAKSTSTIGGSSSSNTELLLRPEPIPSNPAEEAAKMGMFGKLTRSTQDFYPTRLLCKRFNVKAPLHVQPDHNADDTKVKSTQDTGSVALLLASGQDVSISSETRSRDSSQGDPNTSGNSVDSLQRQPAMSIPKSLEVNPDRNEAAEGAAANADVLRAIFGDSDSEDE